MAEALIAAEMARMTVGAVDASKLERARAMIAAEAAASMEASPSDGGENEAPSPSSTKTSFASKMDRMRALVAATEAEAKAKAAAAASPLDGDGCEETMGLDLFADEEETLVEVVGDLRFELVGCARDAGQTLACTGETVWRGCDLIAAWLWRERSTLRADSVVEVGCGLGLGSLVALHCGVAAGAVVATDGDDRALGKAARNAARHPFEDREVVVRKLRWGDAAAAASLAADTNDGAKFGLVLGADVVYDERAVAPLVATVLALLADDGLWVLAFARRGVDVETVVAAAAEAGLAAEDVPRDDARPGERLIAFRRSS